MSDKEMEEYTAFVEDITRQQRNVDIFFLGIYVAITIVLAVSLAVAYAPGS